MDWTGRIKCSIIESSLFTCQTLPWTMLIWEFLRSMSSLQWLEMVWNLKLETLKQLKQWLMEDCELFGFVALFEQLWNLCDCQELPNQSDGNMLALGSGFSCKSLSKLMNDGGSFRKAMHDKNQDHSGFGLQENCFLFIKHHGPWILPELITLCSFNSTQHLWLCRCRSIWNFEVLEKWVLYIHLL